MDCEQACINADNQLHKENIGLRQSIIQNTPLKPMPTKMGTLDSNTLQLQKRAIGATHVQAFIWLDTRRRRTSVSELLGADENPHPETVKTARAIEEYCRKEESREAGPLSNIQEEERKLLSRGSRTEIAEACDILKGARKKMVATSYPISFVKYSRGSSQLALQVRIPRNYQSTLLWMCGETGCSKSRKARHIQGRAETYGCSC